MHETLPSKLKRNTNPECKLVKYLYVQLIVQRNVILYLGHKMSLIRNVSNDSKIFERREVDVKIHVGSKTPFTERN